MTRSTRAIEESLKRFIVDELLDDLYGGGDPLATGAVDSLGIEQLVDYIGEEFGVRLLDEETAQENFESVPVLAGFIDAKQSGRVA